MIDTKNITLSDSSWTEVTVDENQTVTKYVIQSADGTSFQVKKKAASDPFTVRENVSLVLTNHNPTEKTLCLVKATTFPLVIELLYT